MKLSAILEQEGIALEDQGISDCENVPYKDLGFFSWRTVEGYPYLVHFWIKPEERKPAHFYEMVRFVKNTFKSKGFKEMIVNAPKYGYVSKFAQAYARQQEPYRQHDQHYYLLGVDDHGIE